jgi:hypothetical protein
MEAPNYTKPNVTSTLTDSPIKEQEIIQQAFRPGNFTYIAHLPEYIAPNAVSDAHKQRSQNNVETQLKPKPKMCHLWGCPGYIQEFEWMPDEYSASKEFNNKEREENREKRMKIGEKEFKVTAVGKKLKYEDCFSDEKYSYVTIDDQFSASDSHASRLRWIEDLKKVSGEFKPSYKGLAEKKKMLPEKIAYINSKIQSDWEDCHFTVITNEDDLIELTFKKNTVESSVGLHAYMNVMINNDRELAHFKAVISKWGYEDEDFIYYRICPPWVRLNHNEAFFSIHPDMSKANSSKNYSQSSSFEL